MAGSVLQRYGSDFARMYVSQGFAEGEAKGRAEGEALGRAHSVLDVLKVRGIVVPLDVRERILSCRDVTVLEAWLARAVLAKSATDVVGE